MSDIVNQTAEKIKSLKIQGATNVAMAAVKAIKEMTMNSEAENKEAFLREFLVAQKVLLDTRPTEPLMRNAIAYIQYEIKGSEKEKVRDC